LDNDCVNLRLAIFIGLLVTSLAPLWAQTGRLHIRVTDPTGAVVPTASASLLDANDRPVRVLPANDAGAIVWTDLPLGDSHFWVSAPGFNLFLLDVTIRSGVDENIGAALKVGCLEYGPDVKTVQMPYSDTLDLAEVAPLKPAKHHWWKIFH
jgi:hypothetical protein